MDGFVFFAPDLVPGCAGLIFTNDLNKQNIKHNLTRRSGDVAPWLGRQVGATKRDFCSKAQNISLILCKSIQGALDSLKMWLAAMNVLAVCPRRLAA